LELGIKEGIEEGLELGIAVGYKEGNDDKLGVVEGSVEGIVDSDGWNVHASTFSSSTKTSYSASQKNIASPLRSLLLRLIDSINDRIETSSGTVPCNLLLLRSRVFKK